MKEATNDRTGLWVLLFLVGVFLFFFLLFPTLNYFGYPTKKVTMCEEKQMIDRRFGFDREMGKYQNGDNLTYTHNHCVIVPLPREKFEGGYLRYWKELYWIF